MSKRKLFSSQGLGLLSLPIGKNDSVNTARKNIADLEMTTSANMISLTGVKANSPMLMCGKYNKLYPVLKQMLRMLEIPYVLVG